MRKNALFFVLLLAMLTTAQTAVAAFQDVKVDLTNGNLLEESELVLEHTKDRYEIRLADAQATADRCKELEALRRELEEKLKDSERALSDYKKDA